MKNKKILVVVAHPDDEILGCGGTMARLVKEGNEVSVLILGEGVISRGEDQKAVYQLKEDATSANCIIGSTVIFHDFPDNKFDSIPLLDIVKIIESVKKNIKPDIIFTHFRNDLNIDHRITYQAVITATRPMHDETVKEIYSFEVLSSTEWNYPLSFSPNVFFDISSTLKKKFGAMVEYTSEIRDSSHPRSMGGIQIQAENWGMKVGFPYAEAFECVRMIK